MYKSAAMKPLLSVSLAGVLLAEVAGCAIRLPTRPDAETATIFQRMDTNHDGRVTRAEFSAGFADAILTVYNQPATGSVTAEQWNGIERARSSAFAALDRNHYGKLARDEMTSGPQRDAVVNRIFDRIDKNHDGVISVEEGRPSGLDRTPQQRAEGTGL